MSSTNRGLERIANDVYPTPDWLTRAILPALRKRLPKGPISVLEPACGSKQAIAEVIRTAWPHAQVTCSDIVEPWSSDFLTLQPSPTFDLVITNPPFYAALEFVQQALRWRRTETSVVAMLLRLNFLGSQKRAPWLRAHMPSVYVSPKRPSFGLNKQGKPGTDSIEYAWFVWDGRRPKLQILDVPPPA